MKSLLIAFVALISTTSLFAQSKVADVAKFDTETFDFGKLKQNVPSTATFVVTNVSTKPLLIQTATPTCGCTISDYTKAPIAPGKTGTIKATFNASSVGAIHKAVTVKFAGVDEIKSINLAGEVMEPAAYDKWLVENKTSIKVKDDGAKVKAETKSGNGTTKTVKKTTQKG